MFKNRMCRTRVFEDLFGEKTSWGRGNLSFTTVNLVRLAILAKQEAGDNEELAIQKYFDSLNETCDLVAEQLYDRYKFQCTAKAKQFPFLMGEGLWAGGEDIEPNQRVEEVLKHGTLGVGYIGLAEALKMLIGEHHGESDEAQDLGLKIVSFINDKCQQYKKDYNLNYSCLATPAEGISGRFTMIDRKEFGVIPEVTDRDYYTNSNHIPVYFPISAYEKIKKESAYHILSLGGHITYIEMDTEAKKNLKAFVSMISCMFDNNIGYGSINHPVDRCTVCGYEGEIEQECPNCGEEEHIDRIRRITGYLVGTIDRWNSFKKAEERDRVKHTICEY